MRQVCYYQHLSVLDSNLEGWFAFEDCSASQRILGHVNIRNLTVSAIALALSHQIVLRAESFLDFASELLIVLIVVLFVP
jgi:hypothetical protein